MCTAAERQNRRRRPVFVYVIIKCIRCDVDGALSLSYNNSYRISQSNLIAMG